MSDSFGTPWEGRRWALVTGAARGLGRAFAIRLAQAGHDVVAVDLEAPTVTAAAVRALGADCFDVVCDVASEDAVAAAHELVADRVGHCSIVVNNAGIYPRSAFEDLTYDEWKSVLTVNVDSMFLVCRAFLPAMRERLWGRVVNVTSGVTHMVIDEPRFAHYVTSKAAVVGLTRALANEYGRHGVTVNAIGPSIVRTPGNALAPDEVYEDTIRAQAIKRESLSEDLAGALAYPVSDEASFVTGQTLYVDGGMTRQ